MNTDLELAGIKYAFEFVLKSSNGTETTF